MHSISNRRAKRKRLSDANDWLGFDFEGQPIDTKVELIRALIPLGLMAVQDMSEAEVCGLAGARKSMESGGINGVRYEESRINGVRYD
ncbi:MAG: hypothetical protein OES46_18630 [Gammaproteobacteria bacterium]|nr:hypothetical protein [Gammaproteobacteria bacterium]